MGQERLGPERERVVYSGYYLVRVLNFVSSTLILLFHIISARPSKQPCMVRSFLKVYMELGSYFLLLQEQIKDIIIKREFVGAV